MNSLQQFVSSPPSPKRKRKRFFFFAILPKLFPDVHAVYYVSFYLPFYLVTVGDSKEQFNHSTETAFTKIWRSSLFIFVSNCKTQRLFPLNSEAPEKTDAPVSAINTIAPFHSISYSCGRDCVQQQSLCCTINASNQARPFVLFCLPFHGLYLISITCPKLALPMQDRPQYLLVRRAA